MSPTLFITGATGNQGGGLIKELLRRDSNIVIHALVRNPESEPAQALSAVSSNIKFFKGDFDNVSAIEAAVADCTAAFLNVSPTLVGDLSGEARHLQNLVTACASTPSLKRIMLSSSGAMVLPLDSPAWTEYIPNNPDSPMTNYMKSKKVCEDIITATTKTDFPEGWSILRGTTFLTNFLHPFTEYMYPDVKTKQSITSAIDPSTKLSYIDPNDLSLIAANGLLSNTQEWDQGFKGKCFPMGKENLTLQQVVDAMNRALKSAGTDKQVTLNIIPREEAGQRAANGDVFVGAQLFQNDHPIYIEPEDTKSLGVDVDKMVGAEEFFEREKEKLLVAVGGA